MTEKIPVEIEKILEKVEQKKRVTKDEQEKMRTFLGTLKTGMVNPANPAKELNNPNPIQVDVSLQRPETIEQRVRRVMSVSARIAAAQRLETPEEADDFDIVDEFDVMPNSPFENVDHFAPMQPEQPADPPGQGEQDPPSPDPGPGEADPPPATE